MKEISYYSQSRSEVASFVPVNIGRILDVGCGQGAFLELIKEKTGAETWGIELMPGITEVRKVDKILTGSVEDLINDIPNDYFDCITFNDILEHLLHPTEVLKMMSPKLTKTGIIIASIPNVRFSANLYELLIKKDWAYKDYGILDSTHIRFFTQISMKRMLEEAGYKVNCQEGINMNSSWKLRLFNFFTFGFHSDIKYEQFVCIGSIKVEL
jgi:2-polyprenyl-3-methyl-5-hydroxy-6-metoxy-1,4-benzoquinol methylase